MPKDAFNKNLTLSAGLKDKFVSDIKRIVWQNKLSPATLNIDKGEKVSEILVLTIELKKKDLEYKLIETIAKQNAHKILFILRFETASQLALYHKKLYKTEWSLDEQNLHIKGLNLDSVWEHFIEQIAFVQYGKLSVECGIDEALQRQEKIIKLQKEIERLEKQAQNEKQPKKKFELVEELKRLIKNKGDI
jgi:hypothetical protein